MFGVQNFGQKLVEVERVSTGVGIHMFADSGNIEPRGRMTWMFEEGQSIEVNCGYGWEHGTILGRLSGIRSQPLVRLACSTITMDDKPWEFAKPGTHLSNIITR